MEGIKVTRMFDSKKVKKSYLSFTDVRNKSEVGKKETHNSRRIGQPRKISSHAT